MTLEKALSYAIDNEGIGIISDERIIKYLDDLQALDSSAVKRVLMAMIEEKHFTKLQLGLSSDNYELQYNNVRNCLVQNDGFQADLVQYVLDCISYAIHKSERIPLKPQSSLENKKSVANKVSKANRDMIQIVHLNDKYLITVNGQSYELDGPQYRAIIRKKDMPIERLVIWLQTYAEENK